VASNRSAIPAYFVAVVVVRHGDRFLLVHEREHGQSWYLPAGRVEPGETISDAAVRETLEESGVRVRLDGVLRVEHTPDARGYARVRVFYAASPADDPTPRAVPNEHSLGATWVALAELDRYPLRGEEVGHVLRYLVHGGMVYPLGLVTYELAPWRS
jgi:phosphatase NudJ